MAERAHELAVLLLLIEKMTMTTKRKTLALQKLKTRTVATTRSWSQLWTRGHWKVAGM
jgi:hypothetical protein